MIDLKVFIQPGSVPPLMTPRICRNNPPATLVRLCECFPVVRRAVWLLAAVAVVMAARGML